MSISHIPVRKKIALKLFQKYRRNEQKLHQLNYIMWECTLRCNLHCLHCGSDCKKDASQKDMPASDFLNAIDQVKEIVNPHNTMIVLTGGEALMRKDIEQIGFNLYERGFPWGIVTNGMLLNKQKLESLLQAGLRAVTISLDGLEKSHNTLRGSKHSFARTSNAINLLTKVPDIVFDVVTCVYQENFSELDRIKSFLVNAGVKKWRIFTIFPVGRAKEHQELQLNPASFKALFDFIQRTREENKIKVAYGCEGFLGGYERKVRDNFFICRAGINVASVLADGSISACPNLRDNFIQGNIYHDNFKEVWENKYAVFRDRSWTKKGICADCEFYNYCEGNGMHLRDQKSGELLFCHLKRIEEGEKS